MATYSRLPSNYINKQAITHKALHFVCSLETSSILTEPVMSDSGLTSAKDAGSKAGPAPPTLGCAASGWGQAACAGASGPSEPLTGCVMDSEAAWGKG